jgi:DNA recombination protein RmuC
MRRPAAGLRLAQANLDAVDRTVERTERGLRDEIGRNREEAAAQARGLREELTHIVGALSDSLMKQVTDMAALEQQRHGQLRQGVEERLQTLNDSLVRTTNELTEMQRRQTEATAAELTATRKSLEERHDAMRMRVEERLAAIQQENLHAMEQMRQDAASAAESARTEITNALHGFNESVVKSMAEMGHGQANQLGRLTEVTDQKLETVRAAVDDRLKALQEDSAGKLESIRRTVDEQLQGTLEKRLGESFRLVSERLEQVHKGLGEMQTLATGVGDLKKVLSNVRARGTWGEVQLGALLEDVLSPDQYDRNVATTGGTERVEFAIRFPGPVSDASVWLPIDAKFPQEDYLRLVEAAERGDATEVEACSRQLEQRISASARDIRDKYVAPPMTTDFGVMYLPTESLYAEVLRRPGLVESLQREYRIAVAGPTTLAAFLNSLRLGFRTLAIQKRSSEVWELLGAVKTEFGKYSEVLDKLKKKLQEAANTVDKSLTRTRVIERKLRDVEALPSSDVAGLLPDVESCEVEEPVAVTAGG